VDHILAINDGGDAWDGENLQSLCRSCHSKKTQSDNRAGRTVSRCGADGWPLDPRHVANGGDGRLSAEYKAELLPDLKPSRIPLTIVTGPPGSGKSTYIRQHAGPDDLLICLDAIMQTISGLPEHHTHRRWLKPALAERNRLLRALHEDPQWPAAWFVVSAADPAERRAWQQKLGGTLVVMDTALDECLRRIHTDPTRAGQTERMATAATLWWQRNPHLSRTRADLPFVQSHTRATQSRLGGL
jgi:5-methylcytosine-specific restriction protein A